MSSARPLSIAMLFGHHYVWAAASPLFASILLESSLRMFLQPLRRQNARIHAGIRIHTVMVAACISSPLLADPGGSATPDLPHGTFLGVAGKPIAAEVLTETSCVDSDAFVSFIPFGVDVSREDVWITTVGDHRIWRTDLREGTRRRVCHVAGNGQQGYSGDGGPAVNATFNWPHEVRVDDQGNLFIADTRNHVIRRIDHGTEAVETLAGNGEPGFAGDGETGDAVQFDQPHSIVLDGAGGLFVADTKNHRLRRIDLETGIIRTVCGTGEGKLPIDGTPAASSPLFGPRSLAVDEDSIWVALREGNSVWRIDRTASTIHHVAGSGKKGYSGDGGPLLEAKFNGPKGIVLSDDGSLAVVDTENHAIRRIDMAAKTVTTILGGSREEQTLSLKRPHGIAFSQEFGLLVADSENDRIVFVRSR